MREGGGRYLQTLSSDRDPFLAFPRTMPWQPDAADFRMGGFGPTAGRFLSFECFCKEPEGSSRHHTLAYPGTSYPGILGASQAEPSYPSFAPRCFLFPGLALCLGTSLSEPKPSKYEVRRAIVLQTGLSKKVQDLFLQKSSRFFILLVG